MIADRLSAVRELKSDGSTAHMPVIFVSGDAFASRRARAGGGSAFLSKPVRAAELLGTVARTLAESESRAERVPLHPVVETAADKR